MIRMKVYVVWGFDDNYGHSIYGIYLDKQYAHQMEKQKQRHYFTGVEEVEFNYQLPVQPLA